MEAEESGAPVRSVSVGARTFIGIVLIAAVGLALWLDSLWEQGFVFFVAGAGIVIVATDEFCHLARKAGVELPHSLLVMGGGLLFMAQWASSSFEVLLSPGVAVGGFFCLATFATLAHRVLWGHIEGAIHALAFTLAAFVYVPFLFGFLTLIRTKWGIPALVTVLAVCKSGDIGAYFGGTFVGRRKLAPTISPGKTVNGVIAAVLSSMAVALILSLFSPWRVMGPWVALLYGAVVAPVAVVADLAESLLKREAKIKDSGDLLPGYGGMLDMVDDVLFVAPLSYFFFRIFL